MERRALVGRVERDHVACAAEAINHRVMRQPEQPGGEGGLALRCEAINRAPGVEEDRGGDVFSLRGTAGLQPDVAVDAIKVERVQLTERLLIAGARTYD